jgi:peptide/nickel transport system substrate-binding protein
VLRVARISDFLPSIHPVNLGTGNQELMADIVFSTLVDVDSDEVTILPDLAMSWEASADATTYTFNLNPAAVWSDGRPVTVEDVFFTIAWPNWYPTFLKQFGLEMYRNVVGGENGTGTAIAPGTIPSGLKKIDDDTIEITLYQPDGTFLRRLAGAYYFIQPEHIVGELTGEQADACQFCLGTVGVTIGSGPYDFATSISATGANFKRKDGYWKGKDGPVGEIVYKIQESNVSVAQLKAGELDLVIRVPPLEGPGLASVAGLKQLNAPGVGIFGLNFNHQQTDREFRQAIAYAINRPQIIDQVLGGLATLNYGIPPGFRLYDDLDKYEFDPTKAKELLAQSEFADKDSIELIYLAEDPNFTLTAPAFQQQIQENLGIQVELSAFPTAPYVEFIEDNNDWEIYLSFGGSEGVGWYQSEIYTQCPGLGVTNLKLQEADCGVYTPLFKEAAGLTGAEQDEKLHELARLLSTNVPIFHLWQPNYLHVYSDRLGGGFRIYPNERESFQSILDWTFAP